MSIEAEIEAQFAGALEIEHELDRFAHQIADEVRDLAPEFGDRPPKRAEPGIGEPGDLKASIQVRPAGPGRRRVQSDDPKAVWAELGTSHFPEIAMFAKVAAMHGGTGPVIDTGVQHAQSKLRGEIEKLEKMTAEGVAAHEIAAQKGRVSQARLGRSAAFRAARGSRRGRR